jgi:hypothetical protein
MASLIESSNVINRYEKALAKLSWSSPRVCSSFSQASHAARVSTASLDHDQQIIWNTSANVIGPLYVSFVWWILKRAQEQGINRLYFMARDGLILKEIADQLIPAGNFQIETRYLYVSRQSVLYASVSEIDDFDIRWFMWNLLTPFSVKTILQRLDISPTAVRQELRGFKIADIERPLSFIQKLRFRKFFCLPKIKAMILERAREFNVTTKSYLIQEGFAEGVSFALVDIGWLALSQYALSRILDKDNSRPKDGIKGFYLGTNWLLRKYRNDSTESFLYNPFNMLWRMPVVQYELPEIFATVDHGRTLRYENKDGLSVPVLGEMNLRAKEWGSAVQKKGVLEFTKRIVSLMPGNFWQEYSPQATVGKVFSLFCNWPSQEEARVYGCFVHGADMAENECQKIAPVIAGKDLMRVFKGYFWAQGCIRRSSFGFKSIFVFLFIFFNIVRHGVFKIVDVCVYR